MVIAYLATKEDQALLEASRVYNGQRIDLRWSGGWLTPEGLYYPVDYLNGITHDTIAVEQGSLISGSGSITTRPPIMRIFDVAKWVRITYLEGSSFCVELKGGLERKRQAALLSFVKDYKDGFESYFINDTHHVSFRDFIAAIRSNDVVPTHREIIESYSEPKEPQKRKTKIFSAIKFICVLLTITYIVWVVLH